MVAVVYALSRGADEVQNVLQVEQSTAAAKPSIVKKAPFSSSVAGFGHLIPLYQQSIVAQSPGVIKKLLLRPGNDVTPDSTIIQLSNPVLGSSRVFTHRL